MYSALTDMVDEGELLFPPQVYEELARARDDGDEDDLPCDWAKQNKDEAIGGVTPIQLLEAVIDVQKVVDNLVDVSKPSPGDDADPYVVGLALHFKRLGHEVTVITEDRRDFKSKTSMQSACALLHIPALSMRAFLGYKAIWPRRRPR